MRYAFMLAMAGAMLLCAEACKSGGTAVDASVRSFAGTWNGDTAVPGKTTSVQLVVRSDHSARFTLKETGGRKLDVKGTVTPGSDILSFVEDPAKVGNPPPAQHAFQFLPRPDGTLETLIEGTTFVLRKAK